MFRAAASNPERRARRCDRRASLDLLAQGTDMVRALLDHEDLSTTALYTKVTDAQTAKAVLALRGFTKTPPAQIDASP